MCTYLWKELLNNVERYVHSTIRIYVSIELFVSNLHVCICIEGIDATASLTIFTNEYTNHRQFGYVFLCSLL